MNATQSLLEDEHDACSHVCGHVGPIALDSTTTCVAQTVDIDWSTVREEVGQAYREMGERMR